MSSSEDTPRTLSDADIDAILDRAEKRFYLNLGKGLWKAVWAVVLVALISIAAVGYHGR
jgi:hypothetical protein